MVQAAARGVIDFRTADTLDRRWWIRLRWLLDQLEVENAIHVRTLQHAQHLSLVDYGLPEKAFDTHWGSANDILTTIYKAYFPWDQQAGADNGRTDAIAALRQKWIERWGDWRDPETKAKIREAIQQRRKRIERAKTNQPKFSEDYKRQRKMLDRARAKRGR